MVHYVSKCQHAKIFPMYLYTGSYFHKEISYEDYMHCQRVHFSAIFGKQACFDFLTRDPELGAELLQEALILKNLRNFNDKIIFIGLKLKDGYHVMVVANVQGRYLLFNPGSDLIEVRSLEELNRILANLSKPKALGYFFVFGFDKDQDIDSE